MDEPQSERITTAEMIEAIMATLANARIEGEPYKSKAEEHLAPIEAILVRIVLERADVDKDTKLEEAALKSLDRKTDALLADHADAIWNQLGCPDYDPVYNVLFPSVVHDAHDKHAKTERLLLVADLLSSGIHPKIDRAYGSRAASEIRSAANEYHERIFSISKHRHKRAALEAFEASVARIGLLELGTLRKSLRGMGIDDTHIKSVVPPPASSRRITTKNSR